VSGMKQGTLFVVSAPSGAGKTSLVRELRASLGDFTVSISHTTRARRPGEQQGQDYFFVERVEFERMVAQDAFLEYARVFDHYYGTARETVEATLAEGKDVMLEIDWQGARQIKKLIPSCLSIFVLPPSRDTLTQRLQGRGQDDAETIARRMRDAISEMSHYGEYDYLIVNDDFQTALEQMRAIVVASRLKTPRQAEKLAGLIESLLD
jgi:guanylate kinase